MKTNMLPLKGITVLEFAQFMAGPSAGLKLADLGARVIKIERPGTGEAGRKIAIKNLFIGNDSLVFHTINRNKESYTANLKNKKDLAKVKKLIAQADIITHNFRPGVMEKIGLDYELVRKINPQIIYGEVTGYGKKGPWAKKPGQDLLIQSLSGLNYLTGNKNDHPTPMGIAAADMITGAHLVQGILAAVIHRQKTGKGSKISVSLLESTLDLQFEVITTYLNDGHQLPVRARRGNAHAYQASPYGIYQTKNGYIAIAMVPLPKLTEHMGIDLPERFVKRESWHNQRDEIMEMLSAILAQKSTQEWLNIFEPKDLWCAPVFEYNDLIWHEGYQVLQMDQEVETSDGKILRTTRCPIRIDGKRIFSKKSAPKVGEDNVRIEQEFNLGKNQTDGAWLSKPSRINQPNPVPIKPLEDILVLDLSQFLSGPSASLRLADLGARVIKIEKPLGGDICRSLYVSNVNMNGESSLFHAINRNKESFAANLKEEIDRAKILKLVKKADIIIHNFRPGVIECLGMDYDSIKKINPKIIYGEISGYGKSGPWKNKPGQDLLVQSLSGLTGLSGNDGAGPVPMGLAIVDILAGAHLVQGLLASLARRNKTKRGGLVEISMLESIIEFQFESITTYFQDGGQSTMRTKTNNAHAYLGAPYGVYQTKNGFIALAMGSIPVLGELLGCDNLLKYQAYESWYDQRDEIKSILARHLKKETTEKWLSVLEPADIWCAAVMSWDRLFSTEAFNVLEMLQEVCMSDGYKYQTTRCPIRINDEFLRSASGSPKLGEHSIDISEEFGL